MRQARHSPRVCRLQYVPRWHCGPTKAVSFADALPQAFEGHPRNSKVSVSTTLSTKVCLRRRASLRSSTRSRRQKPSRWVVARGACRPNARARRQNARPARSLHQRRRPAGRDEAAKKVAKAKKSVSFVSNDDDDLPKSDELETLKDAKSSEKDIEIHARRPRNPTPTMT